MLEIWQDKEFRIIFYIIYGIIILTGLGGMIWISDQFDHIRLYLSSLIIIPGITVALLVGLFVEDPTIRYPRMYGALFAVTISASSWGILLLLNTLNTDHDHLMSRNYSSMTMNIKEKRGLFGWVYKTRF